MIRRIVSSGQVGAELAALVAATECGLETGGHTRPKFNTYYGKKPELAKYGLKPGINKMVGKKNVLASDGTLFITDSYSHNIGLIDEFCNSRKVNKPTFFWALQQYANDEYDPAVLMEKLVRWVIGNSIEALNIVGPSHNIQYHYNNSYDIITTLARQEEQKHVAISRSDEVRGIEDR